jgi:hypothetical protein
MCQKAIVHFFWMSIYLPPRIDVHRESVQGFDHGFHPSPPLCAAKRHHLSLRVRAVHAGFLHVSRRVSRVFHQFFSPMFTPKS